MIDSKFRSPYQNLVINSLLKISWVKRLDPILLTFYGLFFGLLIPFFLGLHCSIVALCCLILSGFFDTLDGSLARHLEKATEEGAALDITADRVVEFAIVLGLFFVDPEKRALYCLLMLGSILFCITTFLIVGIFTQKETEKSFYYSPGIIERAEAFIFFCCDDTFPTIFLRTGNCIYIARNPNGSH